MAIAAWRSPEARRRPAAIRQGPWIGRPPGWSFGTSALSIEPAQRSRRIRRTNPSRPSMASPQPFLEARDFLLTHRTDYEAARRGFRWPRLDQFNWALDYFDPMAVGRDRLG